MTVAETGYLVAAEILWEEYEPDLFILVILETQNGV